MNLPAKDQAPLGNWDLKPWLERHRRFSAAAQADLERLLQGYNAAARERVAPAVVFLKHHKHMKALIQAGFSFTTVIVPNHVQGPWPTKEPQDVRRWALFLNASKQTHALLDVQGVPQVHDSEVNRFLADYLRDDRLHSLSYLLNTHPEQARRWAEEEVTVAMLGVNEWLQRPTPRHNTMLMKLLVCGLPAQSLRAAVQDKAPENSPHFERIIALTRAGILTASDAGTVRPTIKAPRL